mgnify:CR=1 FL=1
MKIVYANVYISNLEQSIAFFVEKLGLQLGFSDAEHGYASFAAGPISLGLAVAAKEQAVLVGRPTGIGFAVDDLEGVALNGHFRRHRRRGGQVGDHQVIELCPKYLFICPPNLRTATAYRDHYTHPPEGVAGVVD